jgi:hypothetical protein
VRLCCLLDPGSVRAREPAAAPFRSPDDKRPEIYIIWAGLRAVTKLGLQPSQAGLQTTQPTSVIQQIELDC